MADSILLLLSTGTVGTFKNDGDLGRVNKVVDWFAGMATVHERAILNPTLMVNGATVPSDSGERKRLVDQLSKLVAARLLSLFQSSTPAPPLPNTADTHTLLTLQQLFLKGTLPSKSYPRAILPDAKLNFKAGTLETLEKQLKKLGVSYSMSREAFATFRALHNSTACQPSSSADPAAKKQCLGIESFMSRD